MAVQAVPQDRAIYESADGNGWFMLLLRKEELRNHGYRADEVDDAKPKYNPLLPLWTEAVALSVQPYMRLQVATGEGVSCFHILD